MSAFEHFSRKLASAFDPKLPLAITRTPSLHSPLMPLIAIALLVSATGAEDDLARVEVYPGTWAIAISTWQAKPVNRREVRAVGCVGFEDKRMVCSWEQRIRGSWQVRSAWADLSIQEKPRILEPVDPAE